MLHHHVKTLNKSKLIRYFFFPTYSQLSSRIGWSSIIHKIVAISWYQSDYTRRRVSRELTPEDSDRVRIAAVSSRLFNNRTSAGWKDGRDERRRMVGGNEHASTCIFEKEQKGEKTTCRSRARRTCAVSILISTNRRVRCPFFCARGMYIQCASKTWQILHWWSPSALLQYYIIGIILQHDAHQAWSSAV